ncbi:MAG: hypothetical protein AB3N15_15585 [Paracoccaceae bacterium]
MLRTFVLLAAMTAFVGVIGLMLGGEAGLIIALGLAFAMNFFLLLEFGQRRAA